MKVGRIPGNTALEVSRRRLITGLGAAGGLLMGAGFPKTAFAFDDDEDKSCSAEGLCGLPNPSPHINNFVLTTASPGTKVHFFFPGPVEGTPAATDHEGAQMGGRDPSVIYDFKGFIGQADLNLTGAGTDLNTGMSLKYGFHTDSRFMTGTFLGTDGRHHRGTFAMV